MTSNDPFGGRIRTLAPFPSQYHETNRKLLEELQSTYSLSLRCRNRGFDPSPWVDSEIAFDLADRVEHLLKLSVSDRLRELLEKNRTEFVALTLAEEVALGKFGFLETEEALDLGVRAGLAVVTDGITVAPLQGISSVKVKKNDDGSSYAAIYFAGPIRSAGGTEAAFTLVITDRIRTALGLERYHVNGWGEDETGRLLEELRVYERDVGNFQYKVSDDDLQNAIEHLPIEIDGVETDPVEVVIHRGMKRIETDRVRGGALRVINDGLIGRCHKLLKLTQDLSIKEWEWLAQLKGGRQQSTDETKPTGAHFNEVISGRPVLAFPKKIGGFRLRYGRSCNTGLSTVGLHPAVSKLLDNPVVVGTQIKVDLPGKAATIAFVDSIDPPTVRLRDGSVTRVRDVATAEKIAGEVDMVLHLGDVLISFGDFLENNVKLPSSGYVEEWWIQDFEESLRKAGWTIEECAEKLGIESSHINSYINKWDIAKPNSSEAFLISENLRVPLHPYHLFYWELATPSEILLLRQKLSLRESSLGEWIITAPNDTGIKGILEKVGVPHLVEDGHLVLEGDVAFTVTRTLHLQSEVTVEEKWKDVCDMLSTLAGVPIRHKLSAYVGIRVGRPEKAMLRKMKPPVHTLFPVGTRGGPTRDLMHLINEEDVEVELLNMVCENCGIYSVTPRCHICGGSSSVVKRCPICGRTVEGDICSQCKINSVNYGKIRFPIKQALTSAIAKAGWSPKPPLKGVQGLTNATKTPEALEKGILRRKHDLTIYKDGTVRFDATNAPITHFKPSEVGVSVEKLRLLGYISDADGNLLTSEDQLVELFVQDIVLPVEAGECLVQVAAFVDELLIKVYGEAAYYNIKSKEDLIGRIVMGLAPHTSVGILGRVIGYTVNQVCFAHPYWHSAKRRDCDGDEDAVMLLLDVLLNFSKDFLPAQIGGLMDAPLLIQPIVIPREVQRQAHNFDLAKKYPKEFYEATLKNPSPSEVVHLIDIVRRRLKDESQFEGFGFTHPTSGISTLPPRSVYSSLNTLPEKLEKQIQLAMKVAAVDASEVVESVLKTHLLPDILGNMKAYTSQSFRCKSCGTQYRRVPVKGICLSCGGSLLSTVPRKAVEKYLSIALALCDRFDVDPYIRSRLEIVLQELSSLFAERKAVDQTDLNIFIKKV